MTPFDHALHGVHTALDLGGHRLTLPVARWHAEPDLADEMMLARCAGATLDVGCGPGRLTAALGSRGIPALGIDVSPVAVRLARARGASVLHRDVFDSVPGTGRWRHVLVADGNVGIGGDPAVLLRRLADLLGPGGTVLIELDPPGTGLVRGLAHLVQPHGVSGAFPWARVGVEAIAGPAASAGLRLGWQARRVGRWFAELIRRPS
jgi:SAM-dependent methyltransferase